MDIMTRFIGAHAPFFSISLQIVVAAAVVGTGGGVRLGISAEVLRLLRLFGIPAETLRLLRLGVAGISLGL